MCYVSNVAYVETKKTGEAPVPEVYMGLPESEADAQRATGF